MYTAVLRPGATFALDGCPVAAPVSHVPVGRATEADRHRITLCDSDAGEITHHAFPVVDQHENARGRRLRGACPLLRSRLGGRGAAFNLWARRCARRLLSLERAELLRAFVQLRASAKLVASLQRMRHVKNHRETASVFFHHTKAQHIDH